MDVLTRTWTNFNVLPPSSIPHLKSRQYLLLLVALLGRCTLACLVLVTLVAKGTYHRLAQLVSINGRWARGHATRVLILSGSLAVILASPEGALLAPWDVHVHLLARLPLLRRVHSRLPCVGSLQRSTSLTNRASAVSASSPRTKRTIPLLDVNGMSQKPAWQMARQPAEPPRIICGIRLSRFPPVAIADPELNGGVSRKRSPVLGSRPLQVAKRGVIEPLLPNLSVFTFPGRTDLEMMSVGLKTQNAYAHSALRTGPTVTWGKAPKQFST